MRRAFSSRASIFVVLLGATLLPFVLPGARLASAEDEPSADCEASAAGQAFRNLPAPYAPGPDTSIVHTRLGGRDFYVPKNYFRHPLIGCGVEESGMLLRVLLPEMEGYTEANAREIEGLGKPGWGRKLNILVQALEGARDYRRSVFHPHSGGVDPTGDHPTQYGLLRAGSNRIESGPSHTAIDVFFPKDVETARHFIVCDATEAVPYPGCAHRFQYRGLRTQATYSRDHLAQWREIEAKVRSLLDRFGTPPHEEE